MELLIGLGSVLVAFGLGYLASHMRARYTGLVGRIEKLENESPKRHTHRTCAGIEDATALILDLMVNQKADLDRLDTLLSIHQILRSGPHAYDPERPGGMRPERASDRRTYE